MQDYIASQQISISMVGLDW